jgi:hypothetical protein
VREMAWWGSGFLRHGLVGGGGSFWLADHWESNTAILKTGLR